MTLAATFTAVIVLFMYALVGIHAVLSVHRLGPEDTNPLQWTRKLTLTIFAVVSFFWVGFYIYIIVDQAPPTPTLVYVTRIGHILAAGGMFTIVSLLEYVRQRYSSKDDSD